MPKRASIAIPLDLPDVEVLRTEVTPQRDLIIGVESTLTTATCHRCGRTIDTFYGYDRPIRLRHLPILGMVVFIEIRPKRFRCPFCDDHPTTTQQVDWYTPKAPFTKAYERQLLVLLINGTLTDVAQKEGDLLPDAILGTLDRWIEAEVDWASIPAFAVLGIDEIALKKGHRDYVVIVTAQEASGTVHLLAVLPDRTKATVRDWLARIPTPIRRGIRTVCTDMWEAYVSAAEEVLPHAAIVIDRFHVAQHYRDDVDALRKQELKRLRKELPKPAADRLKRTLWPFRKRAANLEPEEQDRLDQLLAHSPQLEQAYNFREELTKIFDTTRAKAAGLRRIRAWRQRVVASGLTCFAPFLKLLATWLDRIANYFRHHQSSGFVEGLNNKLKVLKRRCYGIYNLRHLFQRITLDLEGYRRFRSTSTPAY
jgi:transposase